MISNLLNKPSNNLTHDELETVITYLNDSYYKEGKSHTSDYEYDQLINLLKTKIPDSKLLKEVGVDSNANFEKVNHPSRLYSLDNVYSIEELKKFIQKLNTPKVILEPKLDGLSISLIYKKGVFYKALTRGDGVIGDDVSKNVMKFIKDIPQKIKALKDFPEIELRGEVYMTFSEFNRVNEERKKNDLPLFTNPRNLTSGTLKSLYDLSENRELKICIYALGENKCSLTSHTSLFKFLQLNKLPTNIQIPCSNLEEIHNGIDKLDTNRLSYDYPTDGVVIKVDDFSLCDDLGFTSKYPKWAIAYKFKAEQAETIIKDVEIQIGRTGTLTPVAILEPVHLSGSTISKCSLHNWNIIEEKDIHIGDTVLIEKAGEIIPQIIKVNITKRTPECKAIEPPENCPYCNSKIYQKSGEVAYKCLNPSCPQRVLSFLKYFVSKDCLNINHVGESLINKLVENHIVKIPSDMFSLKKEDLLSLNNIKEKSAERVLKSISNSISNTKADKLLTSLGISHIGQVMSKKLLTHSNSIENLINLSINKPDAISEIEGVGPEIAKSLRTFFSSEENITLFKTLKSLGFQDVYNENKKSNSQSYNIVLTGTLSSPRNKIKEFLEEQGHKILGTITKNTDYCIAGENAGSKLNKANKLNIKILNEDEFKNYFNYQD